MSTFCRNLGPALTPDRPSVVLDTNIVLDWLLFRDPGATTLAREIESRRVDWRASLAMRREFNGVLSRGAFARWGPDVPAAAVAWQQHAKIEDAEPPTGTLLCSDPDDQVFIDLAVHRRCTWLITRDKALLALSRRASAFGVLVLTPRAWMVSQTPPGGGTDEQP